VVLSLSGDFRNRWDREWNDAIRKYEEDLSLNTKSVKISDELVSMLNWMDWFGHLLKSGLFHQSNIFIKSVGPNMRHVIHILQNEIKKDEEEEGELFWAGLRYLERMLSVSADDYCRNKD